jgi:hypothetical protein
MIGKLGSSKTDLAILSPSGSPITAIAEIKFTGVSTLIRRLRPLPRVTTGSGVDEVEDLSSGCPAPAHAD